MALSWSVSHRSLSHFITLMKMTLSSTPVSQENESAATMGTNSVVHKDFKKNKLLFRSMTIDSCSWLTEMKLDLLVFCFCLLQSLLLCFLRCFSSQHGCKVWLFELFCQQKPIRSFSSDFSHKGVCSYRTAALWKSAVSKNSTQSSFHQQPCQSDLYLHDFMHHSDPTWLADWIISSVSSLFFMWSKL